MDDNDDSQAARTAMIRRAHRLADDHETHVKKAALLLDAEAHWTKTLNKHDRRSREFVLAALKSDNVPSQLQWHSFDRTCSRALKTDREIFLQRLELDDFETLYMNRRYRVPQVFRNDKEIMLKIVSKNSLALSNASQELKADRDVVMAAIQNLQSSGPQAIQYASKKLKSDRRIARTVLRHGYGIKALEHLPRKLREDYKLVLLAVKSSSEECNETYETLSELSEEMVADPDIVLEAVKRRGSNIRFVECLVLIEDAVIIKAACRNDGTAIQYLPDSVQKNILRGSVLKMIIENGNCMALDSADDRWWTDEFILLAAKNGMILCSESMADWYKEDRQLFLDILIRTVSPFEQYNELPDCIRSDDQVGLTILRTNESSDFEEGSLALHLRKEITSDDIARQYMDKIMKFAYNNDACACGGDIWNEKSIVISLCKFDGDYYRFVPSTLKTDLDVVKAALSNSASSMTIALVPVTILQEHVDIAAMAIKACSDSASWAARMIIFRRFGEGLIKQPIVLLEWVRKGWPVAYPLSENIRFGDNQVAVEALKHEMNIWQYRALFRRFPKTIRKNKSVMLPAVQSNPMVFKYIHDKLLQDYGFMLSVVSSGRKSLEHASHKDKVFDALAEHAMNVRANLSVTDSFILHFLRAIAIAPPQDLRAKRRRTCRGPTSQCHLRLLDAGGDAGPSVKRMIAEYADIPIGQDLVVLRSALDTLQFWGY